MTLKDIAKLTGVSVSTVSRILNDKDTKAASAEVRERVWSTIRETGYVPNPDARNLRGVSPKVNAGSVGEEKKYFACVFARNSESNDLFFAELAKSIEYVAYKKGYILKCSFYAKELDVSSFRTTLLDQEIKGLAVLGRFENEEVASEINKQHNIVYVGLNPPQDGHDTIFCDGRKASLVAMETLLGLGHRRIAYIGELIKENRFLGYKEALTARDIPYDKSLVVGAPQTLVGGYCGAEQLCSQDSPFSAIFCANDATAMGCIKYLREQRFKVPEQVSVISIDDVEMSRFFMPMLTTVHIPISELGQQAAKMLIDRIEHGHKLPIKMELPFSLSNRDSCAPYGGRPLPTAQKR